MTWVLILTPIASQQPPAVIGGYSRADAEAAGFAATEFSEKYGPGPAYQRFTVIPGAASSGEMGATHSVTERYMDNGYVVIRTTWRDGKPWTREEKKQPWS